MQQTLHRLRLTEIDGYTVETVAINGRIWTFVDGDPTPGSPAGDAILHTCSCCTCVRDLHDGTVAGVRIVTGATP